MECSPQSAFASAQEALAALRDRSQAPVVLAEAMVLDALGDAAALEPLEALMALDEVPLPELVVFLTARQLREQGRAEEALPLLEVLSREGAPRLLVLLEHARALHDLGRFSDGLALLQPAPGRAQSPQAQVLLAAEACVALAGLGRHDEGLRLCTELLAGPGADSAVIWSNRGGFALALGEWALATSDVQRALALDPTLASAQQNQALLARAYGGTAGAQGDEPEASSCSEGGDHG